MTRGRPREQQRCHVRTRDQEDDGGDRGHCDQQKAPLLGLKHRGAVPGGCEFDFLLGMLATTLLLLGLRAPARRENLLIENRELRLRPLDYNAAFQPCDDRRSVLVGKVVRKDRSLVSMDP